MTESARMYLFPAVYMGICFVFAPYIIDIYMTDITF